MRSIFNILTFFIFGLNVYGQKVYEESFTFKNNNFNYSLISANSSSIDFNVVIIDSKIGDNGVKEDIKLCSKKKKGNIYYLVIPKEISIDKESFVLEFLCNILSKRKLIDKEMNLITDDNYFNLYEKARSASGGKYKNCFLNKIHKMTIVDTRNKICESIN